MPEVQVENQTDATEDKKSRKERFLKFLSLGIAFVVLAALGIGFGLYKAGIIGGVEQKPKSTNSLPQEQAPDKQTELQLSTESTKKTEEPPKSVTSPGPKIDDTQNHIKVDSEKQKVEVKEDQKVEEQKEKVKGEQKQQGNDHTTGLEEPNPNNSTNPVREDNNSPPVMDPIVETDSGVTNEGAWGISAAPKEDDFSSWTASIIGPNGSPYENRKYDLSLNFPNEYPFLPPEVKFVTPIFHPNVDSQGNICLNILKSSDWNAKYDVQAILLAIQYLMGEPGIDSPLNLEAANLWSNKEEFRQAVISKTPGTLVTPEGTQSTPTGTSTGPADTQTLDNGKKESEVLDAPKAVTKDVSKDVTSMTHPLLNTNLSGIKPSGKRLVFQLKRQLREKPNWGITAFPDHDNIYKWKASITGPDGSPYENRKYNLSMEFPDDYPTHPPEVKFVTPIFHPNVDSQGNICLSILNIELDWSPCYGIQDILLSIQFIMGQPGLDSPLDVEAGKMWNNKEEFLQAVKTKTPGITDE